MKAKKIYLCGPTNGLSNQLAEFIRVRTLIHAELNMEVVFPAFVEAPVFNKGTSNAKNIKDSIKEMLDCDFVVTLDNWENDEACAKEYSIARRLEIEVYHFTALEKIK